MPSALPSLQPDSTDAHRELRVATYNLYLGADLTVVFDLPSREQLSERAADVHRQVQATDFAYRAEAVASILVRERVDLVGLQEVARWTRTVEGVGGGEHEEVWLDFLPLLLDALSAAGEEYHAHAVTRSFRGGARVAGEITMSVTGRNAVLVRAGSGIEVTAERVGDYSRTLEIRTGPDLVLDIERSWGWVDATVDGRPFRLVNTHTEAWDETVRDAQRDELVQVVGEPGVPVVLVGDLNAVPEKVGLPEEYVDAWMVAGDGPGMTCGQTPDLRDAVGDLRSRIDYVFVRGAEVTGCRVVGDRPEDRVGGLWPSDHAGVVATLRLPAESA